MVMFLLFVYININTHNWIDSIFGVNDKFINFHFIIDFFLIYFKGLSSFFIILTS
jgi:hypothetical protein